MTPEDADLAEALPVVIQFYRARLGTAEAVTPGVVSTFIEQHRRDGGAVRVTALRIASRAVAATISQDVLAPGSMEDLLGEMPPVEADVLAMRVVVSATAEALGITPAAVLIAQHRALSALRTILAS